MRPMPVRARLVVSDFDAVVAAYERLGFRRVLAWDGGTRGRSALFRAGPSSVEVVERTAATTPRPTPLERKALTA